MVYASLSHIELHRPGRASGRVTTAQRYSSDFLVDGRSLLRRLVAIAGGHDDFMGCFVRGFEDVTKSILDEMLPAADSAPLRVGIYVCPECGDISCGRYSVGVQRTGDAVVWNGFAYESGDEAPSLIEELGSFRFELSQYEQAIRQAANP